MRVCVAFFTDYGILPKIGDTQVKKEKKLAMEKEKRKRRTPKILKRAEDFFQSLENNCDFNLHCIFDDLKKMSNILIGCKCKFCLNAGNYLQFRDKFSLSPRIW